jgi:pyruvate,orthophosphate dikinase
MSENFLKLLEWSDQVAGMKVLANADNEHDAKAALELGAQGIGLCRTEHMFFAENRILAVRRLILADSSETRSAALDKLYLMQKGDFEKIFKVMAGLPVTVRLLDPPLHEFIPRDLEAMQQVAETTGKSIDFIRRRVAQIEEANPMLGHRGCRLGISYPEIYQMQTRAILEAVASLQAQNVGVYPEIMVPLVMDVKEFMIIKKLINDIANKLPEKVEYKIGVMIELPRAALKADEIADLADFFSFGTNDLTQTTLGMSRDDSHNFIPLYLAEKIFNKDPFCTLDITGVGELVKIATKRGRSKKSSLKIGLCGEHGGDAETIFFCHQTGIDYVSCSPYRVPVARLLAAQAALKTND